MSNLFSVNWWISVFLSTLFTMAIIVLIKRITSSVNIPLVSELAQEV